MTATLQLDLSVIPETVCGICRREEAPSPPPTRVLITGNANPTQAIKTVSANFSSRELTCFPFSHSVLLKSVTESSAYLKGMQGEAITHDHIKPPQQSTNLSEEMLWVYMNTLFPLENSLTNSNITGKCCPCVVLIITAYIPQQRHFYYFFPSFCSVFLTILCYNSLGVSTFHSVPPPFVGLLVWTVCSLHKGHVLSLPCAS